MARKALEDALLPAIATACRETFRPVNREGRWFILSSQIDQAHRLVGSDPRDYLYTERGELISRAIHEQASQLCARLNLEER